MSACSAAVPRRARAAVPAGSHTRVLPVLRLRRRIATPSSTRACGAASTSRRCTWTSARISICSAGRQAPAPGARGRRRRRSRFPSTNRSTDEQLDRVATVVRDAVLSLATRRRSRPCINRDAGGPGGSCRSSISGFWSRRASKVRWPMSLRRRSSARGYLNPLGVIVAGATGAAARRSVLLLPAARPASALAGSVSESIARRGQRWPARSAATKRRWC